MSIGIFHDGSDQSVAGRFYNPWAKLMLKLGKVQVINDGREEPPRSEPPSETQVYCHGSSHHVFFDGRFAGAKHLCDLLSQSNMLPDDGGLVWVRACGLSNDFLARCARYSGCYFAGFSDTVHAFQGSLKVFSPDGELLTPDDVDVTGEYSAPWKKRTVPATQVRFPREMVTGCMP